MATFDYTSRDFYEIKKDLVERASTSLPEWTDRDPSDFMSALVDIWAYAADVLHFYVDRAAGESFLNTATQRESVLAMANLYGYTPNPVTSSRAIVTVYNSTAASVTISSGTPFKATVGTNNFNFYSTSPTIVYANGTAEVSVREGVRYTNQTVTNTTGGNVSTGRPTQSFSIYHKNVDPTSITVNVYEGANQSAVEWRQVGRLTNTASSDSVYTVYVAANGTVYIKFGNGVNGRIPPTNAPVSVSYTVSVGASGNISANSITTLNTSDYAGVRVNSSTAAVGGIDAEDIASLKLNIPRALRTQNRAVTLSDFADIALSVGGVSKAVCQYSTGPSSTGGSVSIYVVEAQPDYPNYSLSYIPVEQTVREQVYLYAIDAAMLGVGTIAVPSTIQLTPIYLAVELYVKSNYVYEWVKRDVVAAIDKIFSFVNVSFGQTITIGEFYRAILAVDGVDYAVITNFNTTSLTGGLSSSGKITIDPYKLLKKGDVGITNPGGTGVSPPA